MLNTTSNEILFNIFNELSDADLAILLQMPEFRDIAFKLLGSNAQRRLRENGREFVAVSIDTMLRANWKQINWMEANAGFKKEYQAMLFVLSGSHTGSLDKYFNKFINGHICLEYFAESDIMVPYFAKYPKYLNPDYTFGDSFLSKLLWYVHDNWASVKPTVDNARNLLKIAEEYIASPEEDIHMLFPLALEFYDSVGKDLFEELLDRMDSTKTAREFIYYVIKNNFIMKQPVRDILDTSIYAGGVHELVYKFKDGILELEDAIFDNFKCSTYADLKLWLTIAPFIRKSRDYYRDFNEVINLENSVVKYICSQNYNENSILCTVSHKKIERVFELLRSEVTDKYLGKAIDNGNMVAFRCIVRKCKKFGRENILKIHSDYSLLSEFRDSL